LALPVIVVKNVIAAVYYVAARAIYDDIANLFVFALSATADFSITQDD
jgi:hypothetical protein